MESLILPSSIPAHLSLAVSSLQDQIGLDGSNDNGTNSHRRHLGSGPSHLKHLDILGARNGLLNARHPQEFAIGVYSQMQIAVCRAVKKRTLAAMPARMVNFFLSAATGQPDFQDCHRRLFRWSQFEMGQSSRETLLFPGQILHSRLS